MLQVAHLPASGVREAPGRAAPAAPAAGASPHIVRNSAVNLMAQGAYAVFHLAAVFLLARGLGKELFGAFYTFFALVLAVQIVMEAGLGTVLTCRIARAPAAWRATAAEAAGLFLLVGLATAAAFAGLGGAWIAYRADLGDWSAFAAAGVACVALQAQRFGAGVLHAFERFGLENLAKLLQGGLFLALLLLVPAWDDLDDVLTMFAVSHVAAAAFLLFNLHRHGYGLACRLNGRIVRDWLTEAVPLGLGDILRGLTWQLDTLLLGVLQPAAAVGIYSVAYRPLGPLNWLPRAVVTAALPSFARLAGTDRQALNLAFATSLRLLWVTSLPIVVALGVCATAVITVLAGPAYLEAVVPMRILIGIAALSFLSYQFRFLFLALGRPRLFIGLVAAVLAVEAVLELLLIPQWGYYGACAGSVVGELLYTVAGLVLCHRLGLSGLDRRAVVASTLAAAVMAAVLWPARELPLPLLAAAVALATGLYVGLCAWWGALAPDEVRRCVQLVTRRRAAVPRYEPVLRYDMSHLDVRQRYQDTTVVECYDQKRFTGPIGRTIDALEKRAIRKVLATARKHVPFPAVLDVPCGTGRITELLLDQGLNVLGGDISPAMVEAARRKLVGYGSRVEFSHLDLEALDLPDGSFDLITCIRLFNHIGAAEQERILAELARVTRRYVVLNISFSSALYRPAPYLKRAFGMPMPKALPSWADLKQRAAKAGLVIADFAYELRFLSEVVVLLLEKRGGRHGA